MPFQNLNHSVLYSIYGCKYIVFCVVRLKKRICSISASPFWFVLVNSLFCYSLECYQHMEFVVLQFGFQNYQPHAKQKTLVTLVRTHRTEFTINNITNKLFYQMVRSSR
jgi:hypothetical protein